MIEPMSNRAGRESSQWPTLFAAKRSECKDPELEAFVCSASDRDGRLDRPFAKGSARNFGCRYWISYSAHQSGRTKWRSIPHWEWRLLGHAFIPLLAVCRNREFEISGEIIRNDTGRLLILAHEKLNKINDLNTSSGPTRILNINVLRLIL